MVGAFVIIVSISVYVGFCVGYCLARLKVDKLRAGMARLRLEVTRQRRRATRMEKLRQKSILKWIDRLQRADDCAKEHSKRIHALLFGGGGEDEQEEEVSYDSSFSSLSSITSTGIWTSTSV